MPRGFRSFDIVVQPHRCEPVMERGSSWLTRHCGAKLLTHDSQEAKRKEVARTKYRLEHTLSVAHFLQQGPTFPHCAPRGCRGNSVSRGSSVLEPHPHPRFNTQHCLKWDGGRTGSKVVPPRGNQDFNFVPVGNISYPNHSNFWFHSPTEE